MPLFSTNGHGEERLLVVAMATAMPPLGSDCWLRCGDDTCENDENCTRGKWRRLNEETGTAPEVLAARRAEFRCRAEAGVALGRLVVFDVAAVVADGAAARGIRVADVLLGGDAGREGQRQRAHLDYYYLGKLVVALARFSRCPWCAPEPAEASRWRPAHHPLKGQQ